MREQLTELAVDYLIHQVPVARDHRTALVAATGAATIPTLRLENGTAIVGEEAIELYLAEHFDEPPEAKEHRLEAATAHRSFLGMRMLTTRYTLSATTHLPFADAVERVRSELRSAGFGVLCEIDVQATMREKLGVEREPYVILGACNLPLAHQALEAEPELGPLAAEIRNRLHAVVERVARG